MDESGEPKAEARDGPLDAELVVRTIGRSSVLSVLTESVQREHRLARIIVVLQNATPELESAVEDAARGISLEVISAPEPLGLAGARRAGVRRTSADWVAFLDDDIEFVQGSLSELIAWAERAGAGGAGGIVTNYTEYSLRRRVLKRVLFRGIYRDPRSLALVRRQPYRSPVLSGGVFVLRGDIARRVVRSLDRFDGYGWGEDFEFTFAASREVPLLMIPTVRVTHSGRGVAVASDPKRVAVQRLERYHQFASAHAASALDYVHYLLVIAGSLGGAGRNGLSAGLVRAVSAEVRWALSSTIASLFHERTRSSNISGGGKHGPDHSPESHE